MGRIFKANSKGVYALEEANKIYPHSALSDAAMEKLAKLMNDSPNMVKLHGTEWEIHSLKPAVQWLIAEEACHVVTGEKMSMGDVLKAFSVNFPSVVNVLTLALLNDKEKLFVDYEKKIYSSDYYRVRDTLLWGDYGLRDWIILLGEVLQMIDVNFFFESTNVIKTVREMTLGRKMTKAEAG